MTPAKGAEQRALNLDFEALYGAHFDHLTLQLYAYTGDLGLAQDVVQEAFCRALL